MTLLTDLLPLPLAPSEWPGSAIDPTSPYMIWSLLPFLALLLNHSALHIQPQPHQNRGPDVSYVYSSAQAVPSI